MTEQVASTLPPVLPRIDAQPETPRLDVGIATAVGKHGVNEDQLLVATSRGHVLSTLRPAPLTTPIRADRLRVLAMVADGMGGHGHGDLASTLVTRHVAAGMASHLSQGAAFDAHEVLSELLVEAHLQLRDVARGSEIDARFGTTATVAWIDWPRLVVAHVGDSRLYLGRRGRLRRITRDHTLAERLRESGAGSGAMYRRLEHTLWTAVAGASAPEVELFDAELRDGDTVLMCSDGLHGALGDGTLARLLWRVPPAPSTAAQLTEHAKRMGQDDDVSVLVLRFEGR